MVTAISETELEAIERAGRLFDVDKSALRAAIEAAKQAYRLASAFTPRISKDNLEDVKKFTHLSKQLLTHWQNLPQNSKRLFYVMAHSTQSKYGQPLRKIDSHEFLEHVDEEACEAAIQTDIRELLLLGLIAQEFASNRGRPTKSLEAKAIVDCLYVYWAQTLNRKVTFTHDGSVFENFVRKITKLIAPDEIENVSTYVRALPKSEEREA